MNIQSAGGIVTNKRRVVIVFNRGTGSVTFPKSRIREGESQEQASLREIREETGLAPEKVTLVKKLGSYTRPGGSKGELKDIHLFLYRTDAEELLPEDPENTAEWVALDDVVARLSYPEDRAFFESYRGEY